jgi:hypothetical protein
VKTMSIHGRASATPLASLPPWRPRFLRLGLAYSAGWCAPHGGRRRSWMLMAYWMVVDRSWLCWLGGAKGS